MGTNNYNISCKILSIGNWLICVLKPNKINVSITLQENLNHTEYRGICVSSVMTVGQKTVVRLLCDLTMHNFPGLMGLVALWAKLAKGSNMK